MDTHWSELQAHGIEVEEIELSKDEFEHLMSEWMADHPDSD